MRSCNRCSGRNGIRVVDLGYGDTILYPDGCPECSEAYWKLRKDLDAVFWDFPVAYQDYKSKKWGFA